MATTTKPKYKAFTTSSDGVKKIVTVDPSMVEQEITAAGAINLTSNRVIVTGPAASTYAITLAAPSDDQIGQFLTIYMVSTTSTNAVTLALTNVAGGTAASSASFDAAAEQLVLVAAKGKWAVVAQIGVTLS